MYKKLTYKIYKQYTNNLGMTFYHKDIFEKLLKNNKNYIETNGIMFYCDDDRYSKIANRIYIRSTTIM